METKKQASGGEAAVATQPMSHHALPGGVADERLTNGVRCASVADMKTRLNPESTVAGVVQPALSAVLLSGVAGERPASGVGCAKVAGMNRRPGTQNTGGGGFLN